MKLLNLVATSDAAERSARSLLRRLLTVEAPQQRRRNALCFSAKLWRRGADLRAGAIREDNRGSFLYLALDLTLTTPIARGRLRNKKEVRRGREGEDASAIYNMRLTPGGKTRSGRRGQIKKEPPIKWDLEKVYHYLRHHHSPPIHCTAPPSQGERRRGQFEKRTRHDFTQLLPSRSGASMARACALQSLSKGGIWKPKRRRRRQRRRRRRVIQRGFQGFLIKSSSLSRAPHPRLFPSLAPYVDRDDYAGGPTRSVALSRRHCRRPS